MNQSPGAYPAVMPVPSLRELRGEDAPTIQSWLHTYLAEHLAWWQQVYGAPPESDLSELVQRNWQELMEAGSPRQWVRVIGEAKPQGIVLAETRQDRYMGFEVGVLSWIYVEPGARGQGVAAALMTGANEWMAAQGVRGKEVFVTAQNVAAVRLYQRHGYQICDHRMLGR